MALRASNDKRLIWSVYREGILVVFPGQPALLVGRPTSTRDKGDRPSSVLWNLESASSPSPQPRRHRVNLPTRLSPLPAKTVLISPAHLRARDSARTHPAQPRTNASSTQPSHLPPKIKAQNDGHRQCPHDARGADRAPEGRQQGQGRWSRWSVISFLHDAFGAMLSFGRLELTSMRSAWVWLCSRRCDAWKVHEQEQVPQCGKGRVWIREYKRPHRGWPLGKGEDDAVGGAAGIRRSSRPRGESRQTRERRWDS